MNADKTYEDSKTHDETNIQLETVGIINKLDNISSFLYQNKKPYPYTVIDNFLSEDRAIKIQKEIIEIHSSEWDRYNNPFEQKYTLRDKYRFPPSLNGLFEELTSDAFVGKLSSVVGYKLLLDSTRNFWGVHKYCRGDKLDIHVDAGYHPTLNSKKQVTFGLYLSDNWNEEYGCHLEIWKGTSCIDANPKLIEKVVSIAPIFNRCVLFTCNDYSWHGNPTPVCGDTNSTRIFLTISYLSKTDEDANKRKKAYFIDTPDNPYDEEKKKLRDSRADENKYKDIYII
jgi:hypothetical protein